MAKYTSKTALELTGSDISKMNRNEMASMVSVLASAANKRIKRLENAGQPITDTWKKFSVAGKSRTELMKEFTRVKNFLSSEQLSLSGQKRVQKRVAEAIANKKKDVSKMQDFLSDKKQFDKFWRAYEMLKETNPIIANKQYKYLILKEQTKFLQENPRSRKSTIHKHMQELVTSTYKLEQEDEEDTDAFSIKPPKR